VTLDWPADVRDELAADPALARLAHELPGGRHCRPDGAAGGTRIKLGWAFNREPSRPVEDLASAPELDPVFPELALRGLAPLLPGLAAYVDEPPRRYAHYGGYYTMTRENWPLIGPLGPDGAFVVAALSGFGTMAACAAGHAAAAWLDGTDLPPYAADLCPARYSDAKRIATLTTLAEKSLL
ncbi:MAG: hypothetical protein R3176_12220, partial [Woeseiaceae bacterium]|nr:hypothetical protein [Woeseiaceae bacterium]